MLVKYKLPLILWSHVRLQEKIDQRELPTPSSTPTQGRKNRRRSNLFNVSSHMIAAGVLIGFCFDAAVWPVSLLQIYIYVICGNGYRCVICINIHDSRQQQQQVMNC